jgi:hypothetical protein
VYNRPSQEAIDYVLMAALPSKNGFPARYLADFEA